MRYLKLIRASQFSAYSQTLAINLLVNAKLPQQNFTNILASLINNFSMAKHTHDPDISLNKARFEKIIVTMKMAKIEQELLFDVEEIIIASKTSIKTQSNEEYGNSTGLISLKDAIDTL